eukprot:9938280-Alexandrium_andersonii.AAC.1
MLLLAAIHRFGVDAGRYPVLEVSHRREGADRTAAAGLKASSYDSDRASGSFGRFRAVSCSACPGMATAPRPPPPQDAPRARAGGAFWG